jgi:hypothetical protein
MDSTYCEYNCRYKDEKKKFCNKYNKKLTYAKGVWGIVFEKDNDCKKYVRENWSKIKNDDQV